MKKILAIVGSNSASSINRKLAAYTGTLFQKAEVEIFDLQGFDVPIFNPDLEKEKGFPQAVKALFDKLQEQDGFIIASPEYNGSIPAAFKNMVDWISRIDMKFLGGKPTLLLSTSPGKNGGATNLKTLANLIPWWGASLVEAFSLGNFHQEYDIETEQLSGETADKFKTLVEKLENAIELVEA